MKNNIKAVRQSRGLTQQELADCIGTTKHQVFKLESGETDFRCSTLVKISKALGVSVAYLLDLNDEAHTDTRLIDMYNTLTTPQQEAIYNVVACFCTK